MQVATHTHTHRHCKSLASLCHMPKKVQLFYFPAVHTAQPHIAKSLLAPCGVPHNTPNITKHCRHLWQLKKVARHVCSDHTIQKRLDTCGTLPRTRAQSQDPFSICQTLSGFCHWSHRTEPQKNRMRAHGTLSEVPRSRLFDSFHDPKAFVYYSQA